MEAADAEGLNEETLQKKMEENRSVLNESLPAYSRITKIELYPEEFEKTPTKKIKRFLYTIPMEDSKK
jgi:long-chain acyl-CoA synthetase